MLLRRVVLTLLPLFLYTLCIHSSDINIGGQDVDIDPEDEEEGHSFTVNGEEKKTKPTEEDEEKLDTLSDDQQKEIEGKQEKYEFQAEVSRLMDIIINSLYTQKEVFLRELISNAADALEKARYMSVSSEAGKDEDSAPKDLEVKIDFDKEAKTLSLTDTGIGMTKADLINNLGTVAKSGTTNFLEAMAKGAADVNLIGQFGVGFYSSFLVADKVTVTSKHDDDEQHIWESQADANFKIAKDPRGNTLKRGTRITLHLKEDAQDYLAETKLRDLATKFSQFVAFPIYLKVEKTKTEDVPDEDAVEEPEEEEKKDETEEEKKEGEDEDAEKKEKKEKKPKTKSVTTKYNEWEQLNSQKAIWLRSKDEITQQEYVDFYKTLTKDFIPPLAHTHFNAEGEIEFKSIIYIPAKAPSDMFENYFKTQTQLKLYVRRVLVSDSFDDLMPKYLHFVKGVVDSDDLPLNVSREQLQQHKLLKVISKKLVRKTLEMLKKLAKEDEKTKQQRKEEQEEEDKKTEEEKKAEEEKLSDEEKETKKKEDEEKAKKKKERTKFEKFYKEFSRNLKLGCYEDDSNRNKIAKLLRFATSKTTKKSSVSLDTYIENMVAGQDAIYYMAGESIASLMKSPYLQAFKKRDYEVLLLTESMDEPCFQKMLDYEGKKLISIQKGDVKFTDSDKDKKKDEKIKKMYEPLTKWWKTHLGSKISKVEISKRLVTDPVTVVSSEWGYSAYMEKIMKSQAFANNQEIKNMSGSKVLEINAGHPVIKSLLEKVTADENDDTAKQTAEMLFQSAMLASGFDVENSTDLARKLYRYLAKDVGADPDAPVEDVDVGPIEEDEEKEDDDDEKDDEDDDDKVQEAIKSMGGDADSSEDTPPEATDASADTEAPPPTPEGEAKDEL